MPVPKPNVGEKQNEFVSRCIKELSHADPNRPHEQIIAICYSTWRSEKQASVNEQEQEIFLEGKKKKKKKERKPISADQPGTEYTAPNGNYILNPLGLKGR